MDSRRLGEELHLHLAAQKGNDAVVALLIQKEAAVVKRDHYGVTALHLAAHSGNAAWSDGF